MDQAILAIEWIKAHVDMIMFMLLCIEQILPQLKVVDANSIMQLIPELIGMGYKLVKGDYKQDPPA